MSENKIKVNASTSSKAIRVNVSAPTSQGAVSFSQDTSAYNAGLAEQWAISENLVLGQDYSSKYYANQAKESANNAEGFANISRNTYDSIVETVASAVSDVQDVRNEAVEALETNKQEVISIIESEKEDALTNIQTTSNNAITVIEQETESNKQEINTLANTIKNSAKDIINRVGLNMFDTVLKDHVLTYEELKGLALQGTYVYKTAIAGERYGYPDFYAKVVQEYNEATGTETVNGVTIKVNANGHKFYNIADKASIDNFFNTMGTAWFYGIDTENERIFLPRDKYFAVNGNAPVVGNGMTIGLTNGTNNYGIFLDNGNGGFMGNTNIYGANIGTSSSTQIGNDTSVGLTADATKSGIEAHLTANEDKYLYICVGNTVSDTSWVDVVTQVKGGVKDLEDKTLEGIERLKQSSTALTQTQITNCLLEVPQRIKLELTDGTLTLKAGSKVVVPNGFEADGTTPKFDEVEIKNDVSMSPVGIATSSSFFGYDLDTGTLKQSGLVTNVRSGDTDTLNGADGFWYNTATNKIYNYSSGAVVASSVSLSFAIIHRTSGSWDNIEQVFNGIGYIGSTIWVDKGVKGLIPNGRNEDGSLKNIEFTTDKISTFTETPTANTYLLTAYVNANGIGNTSRMVYDETKNILTLDVGGEIRTTLPVAKYFRAGTTGAISGFEPLRPITIYNKGEIGKFAMPSSKYVDLTLGASGTEYTAPANGWYYLDKKAGVSNAYVELANKATELKYVNQTSSSTGRCAVYVPAKKGGVIRATYSATGATNYFRFIYAEGEV